MAAIRSDMADPKVSFGLVWAVVVCRAKSVLLSRSKLMSVLVRVSQMSSQR